MNKNHSCNLDTQLNNILLYTYHSEICKLKVIILTITGDAQEWVKMIRSRELTNVQRRILFDILTMMLKTYFTLNIHIHTTLYYFNWGEIYNLKVPYTCNTKTTKVVLWSNLLFYISSMTKITSWERYFNNFLWIPFTIHPEKKRPNTLYLRMSLESHHIN